MCLDRMRRLVPNQVLTIFVKGTGSRLSGSLPNTIPLIISPTTTANKILLQLASRGLIPSQTNSTTSPTHYLCTSGRHPQNFNGTQTISDLGAQAFSHLYLCLVILGGSTAEEASSISETTELRRGERVRKQSRLVAEPDNVERDKIPGISYALPSTSGSPQTPPSPSAPSLPLPATLPLPFSSAGITITKRRNCLKGDIVEALQLLKSALRKSLFLFECGPSSVTESVLVDTEDREDINPSAQKGSDNIHDESKFELAVDLNPDAEEIEVAYGSDAEATFDEGPNISFIHQQPESAASFQQSSSWFAAFIDNIRADVTDGSALADPDLEWVVSQPEAVGARSAMEGANVIELIKPDVTEVAVSVQLS
ncbi:hypothetical protein CERSUDRAFT_70770 [Gelatoporia subvermispora B]|uniref:Uncharacterized protein n=1 Tax=Ceriporiopsis subvermispora (strain B) TaxID=914234 RepID=M2PUH4_CERS8|nr:hypothetical protein CERSUDRAFT_70770 [Gelatoporia subvermispora B]